jgi:hypothetical protein
VRSSSPEALILLLTWVGLWCVWYVASRAFIRLSERIEMLRVRQLLPPDERIIASLAREHGRGTRLTLTSSRILRTAHTNALDSWRRSSPPPLVAEFPLSVIGRTHLNFEAEDYSYRLTLTPSATSGPPWPFEASFTRVSVAMRWLDEIKRLTAGAPVTHDETLPPATPLDGLARAIMVVAVGFVGVSALIAAAALTLSFPWEIYYR